MPPRVYLETSVVSYLAARPSQDVVVAGHQRTTQEWWRARNRFELVISQPVLDEAGAGDPEQAQQRLSLLSGLPLLDITDSAIGFAERLVETAVIPQVAAEDALHISLAIAHGVDYLVTWNCRHIANALIRPRIERAAHDAGLLPTIICTPEELLNA
jgi:predicted nucleic acid-binding protein